MATKKAETGRAAPADPMKKLRKLVKRARVVMLTTMGADGRFRSRPMQAGPFDEDALWFITRADSAKADEIADNQRVHLAYASRKNERYVSISGLATLVRDEGRVRELWEPAHKAWFPGGKKDPELAVLRVTIEQAEYWDPASGRMVPLIERAAPAPATPGPGSGGRGGKEKAPAANPEQSVSSGALG